MDLLNLGHYLRKFYSENQSKFTAQLVLSLIYTVYTKLVRSLVNEDAFIDDVSHKEGPAFLWRFAQPCYQIPPTFDIFLS
jgi:hypothetical protein